jgi:hypothetical protein
LPRSFWGRGVGRRIAQPSQQRKELSPRKIDLHLAEAVAEMTNVATACETNAQMCNPSAIGEGVSVPDGQIGKSVSSPVCKNIPVHF